MTSPIPFLGAFGGGQSPSFNAPLITTLVPNSSGADSPPNYTRTTTAYVTDFEGLLKQVPSGCARFTGARMVMNGCTAPETSASWTLSGTATVTGGHLAPDGTYSAFKCSIPVEWDGVRHATSGMVGTTASLLGLWYKADTPGTCTFTDNSGALLTTVN